MHWNNNRGHPLAGTYGREGSDRNPCCASAYNHEIFKIKLYPKLNDSSFSKHVALVTQVVTQA